MNKSVLIIGSILIVSLFLASCVTREEKAKQDAIQAIEKDDSLSNTEKELAKNIVQNVDTDKSKAETKKKLQTKNFKLGETIKFSGIELTFTTLEKAMHRSFYEDKQLQMYRLTYTTRNTNAERITPCRLEFVLLDNNGNQVSESHGVMDDGFEGDEVFPNIKITNREWFDKGTDALSGDITIYTKPFVCDETCQLMDKVIGTGKDDNNAICPDFEIKLNIPESQILKPKNLELLNG